MYHLHSFGLVQALLLSLFLCNVTAVVLQDIEARDESSGWMPRLFKRADYSGLDLKSQETFLFGDVTNGYRTSSYAILGNLTVFTPSDTENILAIRKFRGMTKSVKCDNKTIDITFKDDATFDYAKKTWDWVNGRDNHSFVMVAGPGDCGWNTERVPFIITTLKYDEKPNIAHLTAKTSTWEDAAHTYELQVGSMPVASPSLRKRFLDVSFNKDITINFQHPFPFSSFKFPDRDVNVEFACDSCGTTGQFVFGFHLKAELLDIKTAKVTLNPKGVSAGLYPKLSMSANYTGKKEITHEFPGIPIEGVSIPGKILTLGPELVIGIGAELGPVQGSASVSTGISFGLKDSAQVTLDLLKPGVDSSGWTPTVTKKPLTVDAKISAGLKIYAEATLELAAKALGHGYEIGVKLQPYIQADLELTASNQGACPNDKEKHEFGIGLTPKFGVELTAEAAKAEHENDPFLEVNIAKVEEPLPSVCIGVGPKLTDGAKTTPAKPTATSKAGDKPTSKAGDKPSPTGSSSASSTPSSCKNNAGVAGTCISTSSCAGQGGESEPGHCPGAASIQCCTPKSKAESSTVATTSTKTTAPASDATPTTCKNNAGVSGTCISTSSCSSSGGTSEAGHCPGSASIQCCTKAEPASCKNNAGVSGTCIGTATCAGQGGTSEAGHCPGAADIQCCTKPASSGGKAIPVKF